MVQNNMLKYRLDFGPYQKAQVLGDSTRHVKLKFQKNVLEKSIVEDNSRITYRICEQLCMYEESSKELFVTIRLSVC